MLPTNTLTLPEPSIGYWMDALELRDPKTHMHSYRVAGVSLELARCLGLDQTMQEVVHIGALLHDIGKLAIPAEILYKAQPLNTAEWAIIRQHPIIAHTFLSLNASLSPFMDIPLYHHEHWDGSGYPCRLQGSQIPQLARIVTLADAWDAMLFRKIDGNRICVQEAIERLKAGAGKQFDSEIVAAFMLWVGQDKTTSSEKCMFAYSLEQS